VSKEVNDFITGHASGDVAGNYGAGPSLSVRKEAIERLGFEFLCDYWCGHCQLVE